MKASLKYIVHVFVVGVMLIFFAMKCK